MHHNLIPAIFILLVSTPALGQDALGRGNALDSNTSLQGRINRLNDLPVGVRNRELRGVRVLMGRSFNEGLGRFNSGRAQLIADAANDGDEDSYLDVLYNSPWFWNNWDQPSAQFLAQGDRNYYNLNFIDEWATAPRQMQSGRTIRSYSHAWDPDSAEQYGGVGKLEYPNTWSTRQIEQYRIGKVLGTGYQSTPLDTAPLLVGNYRDSDRIGYLAASPLGGIALETGEMHPALLGFSAWDTARATEDREAGIGQDSLILAWRVEEQRLEQGPIDTRVPVTESYNTLLGIIADRTMQEIISSGETEAKREWFETQYSFLQDQLAGTPLEVELTDDEIIFPETTEVEESAISDIGGILRHGERISQLSSLQQTRFDELVHLGELKLAAGEYFYAQQRFKQALRFIPGHPLATAGLGHANIGAGLYLSASNVLQSLLSLQPEMIDVEYDPQLLPPRIELVRAGIAIRNRLDQKRDGGAYAFLLAYIGHQLHDEEMIEQGLEALELRTAKTDPIVRLLRSIWSEETATDDSQGSQSE